MEFFQSMGTDFAIGWGYWLAVILVVMALIHSFMHERWLEFAIDHSLLTFCFFLMYNGFWLGFLVWFFLSVFAIIGTVMSILNAPSEKDVHINGGALIVRVVILSLVGLQI